jgi:hypothetical protein
MIVECVISENDCGTGVSCDIDNRMLKFSRVSRAVARMFLDVDDECAPSALASLRQHFLKLDAVFLHVLVYSGCSASRFPSARSD